MCGLITFISFLPFYIFALVVLVVEYAFQIYMIIDCNKREFKDRNMWLVILCLGLLFQYGLIASIIYYFVVKKEFDKGNKNV